jgi:hypothetical protein
MQLRRPRTWVSTLSMDMEREFPGRAPPENGVPTWRESGAEHNAHSPRCRNNVDRLLVRSPAQVPRVHGLPNRPRAPPRTTGGFGEPTCVLCHMGSELNNPAGSFTIKGLPKRYMPRQVFRPIVRLCRPRMAACHAEVGSCVAAPEWPVVRTAPASGPVTFSASATGADDDRTHWGTTCTRWRGQPTEADRFPNLSSGPFLQEMFAVSAILACAGKPLKYRLQLANKPTMPH